MQEIDYYYQDGYHVAIFTEIVSSDKARRFVVTLKNGKQAFLKRSFFSNDMSALLWVQEPYTEHEVWSAELIHTLGKAHQHFEQKSTDKVY